MLKLVQLPARYIWSHFSKFRSMCDVIVFNYHYRHYYVKSITSIYYRLRRLFLLAYLMDILATNINKKIAIFEVTASRLSVTLSHLTVNYLSSPLDTGHVRKRDPLNFYLIELKCRSLLLQWDNELLTVSFRKHFFSWMYFPVTQ